MPDIFSSSARLSTPSSAPIAIHGSPYEFKLSDRYSSHLVILSLLESRNGGRVLDVGAAHGYLAASLRDRGYRVTGIEVDSDLAREAARYCENVIVADLDGPLPEFKDHFDVILYADVLEHLKNPRNVLVSLNRNLRPGGIVIISVPNIANIYVRLMLLAGRFDYQNRGILDRTHLRFFTRKTFKDFLEDSGLEVLSLSATPIPLPLIIPQRFHGTMLNAVHAFNNWLSRSWSTMFGYQFIAIARQKGIQ